MSEQETREAIFELWEWFGTCIESDSSEGWEMVEAILSRFTVTPKDELKSSDSEHDRLVAERAWAACVDHLDAVLGGEMKRAAHADNPYSKEQEANDA